jgi:hypothetical protein
VRGGVSWRDALGLRGKAVAAKPDWWSEDTRIKMIPSRISSRSERELKMIGPFFVFLCPGVFLTVFDDRRGGV